MNLSTHFTVKELVDPETVKAMGEKRAANTVHQVLVDTLEDLKTALDGASITINSYEWGGNYRYSGVRPHTYKEGATFSSHRYGNTADCKFKTLTPVWVQRFIMKHQDDFPNIVRMEDAAITKTWLHIETSSRKREGDIIVFRP
jgi:hypothetical protein